MRALPSLTWQLLPNPASFHALVALCPATMGSDPAPGQWLCLQGFPGTRRCGSLTGAMADRSQLCCTPACQLKGSKGLPHIPGLLLPPCPPPRTAQTFTAVLALGTFVFIPQDRGGGSQPLPAPFSGSICPTPWEQHPSLQAPWKQIRNP